MKRREGSGVAGAAAGSEWSGRRSCRCRMRSSGCGFWSSWSRGARRTTCRLAVRLKGELNEEALERSLKEIVRRHEVLRTRFVMEDGEAVQEMVEEWMELEVEEDLR